MWVSHSKSHNVCILYGDGCNADNLEDNAEYSTSELSCLPQCTVHNGICEVGGLYFELLQQGIPGRIPGGIPGDSKDSLGIPGVIQKQTYSHYLSAMVGVS